MDESRLLTEHLNGIAITNATLFHGAGVAIMSKEGGKYFQKLIDRLQNED